MGIFLEIIQAIAMVKLKIEAIDSVTFVKFTAATHS